MKNAFKTYARNLFFTGLTTALLTPTLIGCGGVALYTGKDNPEGFRFLGQGKITYKNVFVPDEPSAQQGGQNQVAQNNLFQWRQDVEQGKNPPPQNNKKLVIQRGDMVVDRNGNVLAEQVTQETYGDPTIDTVQKRTNIYDYKGGKTSDQSSWGVKFGENWTPFEINSNINQDRSKKDKEYFKKNGFWPEEKEDMIPLPGKGNPQFNPNRGTVVYDPQKSNGTFFYKNPHP